MEGATSRLSGRNEAQDWDQLDDTALAHTVLGGHEASAEAGSPTERGHVAAAHRGLIVPKPDVLRDLEPCAATLRLCRWSSPWGERSEPDSLAWARRPTARLSGRLAPYCSTPPARCLSTGTGRRCRRIRRLQERIRPPPRKNNATNDFQHEIAISNSLSNSGTHATNIGKSGRLSGGQETSLLMIVGWCWKCMVG